MFGRSDGASRSCGAHAGRWGLAAALGLMIPVVLGAAPAAQAAGETNVLAPWTFDVIVEDVTQTALVSEVRTAHFIDSDPFSMDFDWSASESFTRKSTCPDGDGGATYTAGGSGIGYFRDSFGFPAEWTGLPAATAYTGLYPESGAIQRIGNTYDCEGNAYPFTQSSWAREEIVLLPGSTEELVAAPLGTVLQYSYYRDYAPGSKVTVSVLAVKGVSPSTTIEMTGGYSFSTSGDPGNAKFKGGFTVDLEVPNGDPSAFDTVCFDLTWSATVNSNDTSVGVFWNNQPTINLNEATPDIEEDSVVPQVPIVKGNSTDFRGTMNYCTRPTRLSQTGFRAVYPWDLEVVPSRGYKLREVAVVDVSMSLQDSGGKVLGSVEPRGNKSLGKLRVGWTESVSTSFTVQG